MNRLDEISDPVWLFKDNRIYSETELLKWFESCEKNKSILHTPLLKQKFSFPAGMRTPQLSFRQYLRQQSAEDFGSAALVGFLSLLMIAMLTILGELTYRICTGTRSTPVLSSMQNSYQSPNFVFSCLGFIIIGTCIMAAGAFYIFFKMSHPSLQAQAPDELPGYMRLGKYGLKILREIADKEQK